MMNEKYWWLALKPKSGDRLMTNSLSTTYAFCRTKKFAGVAKVNVQQSDYEHAWEVGEAQIGERNASMLN